MKVKQIDFDDDGDPSQATVVMSAREAALITRMIGKTTHSQRGEFQSDGGDVGTDIYDCLTGDLFYRFYEDGMNDVPR